MERGRESGTGSTRHNALRMGGSLGGAGQPAGSTGDGSASTPESTTTVTGTTAVENGDVYRAGPLYRGPNSNLVVTERLARTLYVVEETLFDTERVAGIVNGEVRP